MNGLRPAVGLNVIGFACGAMDDIIHQAPKVRDSSRRRGAAADILRSLRAVSAVHVA
jgi:pyruvate/2-oxoglutarate/acetoin dehydrogenase E1 component